MVISGEEKVEESEKWKAMEPKKSKPLHNFTMPSLDWNCRKVMVPIKLNSDGAMTRVYRKHSPFESLDKGFVIRRRRSEAKPVNLPSVPATVKSSDRVGGGARSPELGGVATTATATRKGNKEQRKKISVALSWKEIQEDFKEMGEKLHRRPKKRSKIVQNQLDSLFPGLWLTQITADRYKVPDDPQARKYVTIFVNWEIDEAIESPGKMCCYVLE
ncbi:uncharacterized protein LOC132304669 [Cornus florida]|uniref:uncharacterized protein LOC132304669 n=1 Tax=Cornus florida TaxID=4283 RepID=UPI0028994500|nr:uncharacterized protein LOC132304669 [Cornus florida]